jgi:hypothetical protein
LNWREIMRAMQTSLAVLLLPAGAVLAADSTLDAARRCTQVADSLQRLVCFDRAFAAPAAATAAPAPVVAPVAPAVAAAPVVLPPPPASPISPPAPALGDESLRRKVQERADAAPTTLTASVSAMKELRPGVSRLTLDNGQVWEQTEAESLFNVKVGDSVRIDKGKLGGYQMARASNGRSGWVRVTRVK